MCEFHVWTQEYVQLNRDAIRKILKKFDRHVGTAVQQETLARLQTGDKTKVSLRVRATRWCMLGLRSGGGVLVAAFVLFTLPGLQRFWFSDVRARLRQAEELQARLEQMKPHVDDYERRKVRMGASSSSYLGCSKRVNVYYWL